MRYFAMIDGEQRGPYTVKELIAEGVRPDTYVWCKEMVDWQEARYVAEICRAFRQRLSGVDFTDSQSSRDERPTFIPKTENAVGRKQGGSSLSRFLQEAEMSAERFPDAEDLMTHPPKMLIPAAILVTLFFFPLTGIFALYYGIKGIKLWNKAKKESSSEADREIKEAKSYITMSKMLTGISFFLGMIVYVFILSF